MTSHEQYGDRSYIFFFFYHWSPCWVQLRGMTSLCETPVPPLALPGAVNWGSFNFRWLHFVHNHHILSIIIYILIFLWMIVGETGSARGNSPSSHSIPGPFFFFFLMRPQAPVIPPVPSAAERRGFIVAALLHLQGQPQSLPPWASAISSAFLNTVGLSNLLNRNEFSSLPFHFKTLGSFFFIYILTAGYVLRPSDIFKFRRYP